MIQNPQAILLASIFILEAAVVGLAVHHYHVKQKLKTGENQ